MGAQGGRRGNTQASIASVFSKRLKELKQQADECQKAFQGDGQRKWQVPEDLQASLLDIPELHKDAFDRQELNDQYEAAMKSPNGAGTNGDVVALKLQIDYNACEERAFRTRHMTLCRAMAHGHGRRRGQAKGSLWDSGSGISREITSLIAAGGS